jgi:hypothetical protein
MSATSTARQMALKAPAVFSLSRISTRRIATRSKRSSPPSLVAKATDFEIGSDNWKKIISSSQHHHDHHQGHSHRHNMSSAATAKDKDDPTERKSNDDNNHEIDLDNVDMDELKKLASQTCTPLRLDHMYKYAVVDIDDTNQRLRNAQFLHKELAIRIAQRAVDLLTLPHGLSDALPIRLVAHVYLRYLGKLQEFPAPTTTEKEEQFTDMLQSMVLDRTSIPSTIAQGVTSWRENHRRESLEVARLQVVISARESDRRANLELARLQEMEDALYRFFTARVGLRFLTEHHILSSPVRAHKSKQLRAAHSFFREEDDVFLGCIQTNCCPAKEVRKVAAEVERQTKDYYGICPEIQIADYSTQQKGASFTYVPHHIRYMAGELIKNSCRATVKR